MSHAGLSPIDAWCTARVMDALHLGLLIHDAQVWAVLCCPDAQHWTIIDACTAVSHNYYCATMMPDASSMDYNIDAYCTALSCISMPDAHAALSQPDTNSKARAMQLVACQLDARAYACLAKCRIWTGRARCGLANNAHARDVQNGVGVRGDLCHSSRTEVGGVSRKFQHYFVLHCIQQEALWWSQNGLRKVRSTLELDYITLHCIGFSIPSFLL